MDVEAKTKHKNMIRNFFTTFLRNMTRQRLSVSLNIIGLAMAIAVSLLIIYHVDYEQSFDEHIPTKSRLFRISNEILTGQYRHWATTAPLLKEDMETFFPEVELAGRIRSSGDFALIYDNGTEKIKLQIQKGFDVDSTIFSMFGMEFIYGSAKGIFTKLNQVVLTESMSKKFFGNENPLGKNLQMDGSSAVLEVTAVVKDPPKTTHWQYDALFNYEYLKKRILEFNPDLYNSKGWAGLYNYILIKENTSISGILDKMNDFKLHYWNQYLSNEEILSMNEFHFQPITSIHLESHLEEEIAPNSHIRYLYILIIVVSFIIIIAIVNYVNITISLSFRRLKEVGVKKISGSGIDKLRIQFIAEALFTGLLAAVFSVLILDFLLPVYSNISGNPVDILQLFSLKGVLVFVALVVGIGFLSGIYPAIYTSRIPPIEAIKGLYDPTSKTDKLRKALLVFQFTVAVFMIFTTLVIYKQMNYFQSKNLGFDKENLVAYTLTGELSNYVMRNRQTAKDNLLALSEVEAVTFSSNIPGQRLSVENIDLGQNNPPDGMPTIRFVRGDKDYLKTFGIEQIKGNEEPTNPVSESHFYLNEEAVKALQLQNPIGLRGTNLWGVEGEVKGVIKDFNYASLHMVIEPMILEINLGPEMVSSLNRYMIIRLNPGQIQEQLDAIEKHLKDIDSQFNIEFQFIDDYLNSLYASESRLGNLFKLFSLFTLFISCLGLFGITSFNMQLKTKEVCLKKIMGAGSLSIIRQLSLSFMLFILISMVIAIPLAYWFSQNWLQSFAFRISITPWFVLATIILVTLVAWITVLYHSFRMSRLNVVQALKYE